MSCVFQNNFRIIQKIQKIQKTQLGCKITKYSQSALKYPYKKSLQATNFL